MTIEYRIEFDENGVTVRQSVEEGPPDAKGGTGRPDGGNTGRPDGGSTGRPDGGSTGRPDGGNTGRPDGGGAGVRIGGQRVIFFGPTIVGFGDAGPRSVPFEMIPKVFPEARRK